MPALVPDHVLEEKYGMVIRALGGLTLCEGAAGGFSYGIATDFELADDPSNVSAGLVVAVLKSLAWILFGLVDLAPPESADAVDMAEVSGNIHFIVRNLGG